MRLLDPAALSKIGTLALRARGVVEGALVGLHRSPHQGSSVEFAEHKEYSPGDEIRHIDWKAYGKFDRYVVKRFEQETELTAYLLVDRSGSMAYRGDRAEVPSKLEYASLLAASLAYLLLRQHDRVGLLVFGGEGTARYVPPRARSSHLHDLLAVLEATLAEGGSGTTAVAPALERIAEIARRRRALVVVVSDLFDRSPSAALRLRSLRAMGHDVSVLQVLDRDELELPFEGVTLFESLEDSRRLIADPRAVRAAYLRELGTFLDGIRRTCQDGDVEYRLVPTDLPLERTLADFLTRGRSRWTSSPR